MSTSHVPTLRRAGTTPTRQAHTAHAVPLVLGRYRLHRHLGTGGFGTVWAAHDERLDREVAVKIVARERIVGGRFEREARAAARLAHPAIVTLYEATVDDEGAYLVSELVHGATLEQLIDDGRLSDRDILEISIALCDALSHAHAQGVVHRDVKPSNVLVPEHPSSHSHPAKLTDFGVARVIGGDSLTRTGDVIGTAAYMAPEQAEGREAGAAADLYALALMTYEALTGLNPIRTGTAAMRARRLGAYLPPLRRHRRDLPRELGTGIDLALRPRPRERGGVQELREAFLAALPAVEDTPGVVEGGRFRREPRGENLADASGLNQPPLARREVAADAPVARIPWPTRGLAAVVTSALTAWLAAHLLATSPIAPVGAGALAGVLVLALPRLGWLCATMALASTAILQHRPGGAVLVMIAAILPVILIPRRGTSWPLAAVAPALGAVALAGAWPALAAYGGRGPWRRAALGLLGWVWLLLGSPLADADLYTRRLPGTPAPALWSPSLATTAHDVLRPLMSSGLLAGAVVWALAAAVLPMLVRGRSFTLDALLVLAWTAIVLAGTEGVIAALHAPAGLLSAPEAILGAVAGAIVALSPLLIRARPRSAHSDGLRRQLP